MNDSNGNKRDKDNFSEKYIENIIFPLTEILKYGQCDYFEKQVLTQIEGDIEKMKEKSGVIGFQPPFGEEDHIEDEEINIEKIIDQKLADFKHELLKELNNSNK